MSEAQPFAALFHVLSTLPDAAAGRVLFINAGDGAGLGLLGRNAVLVQPLISESAPLLQQGFQVMSHVPDQKGGAQEFDLVLMLTTKQHDETRGLLAQGLASLRQGGLLIVAGANDAGGKRLIKDFAALGLQAESESRDKSRVVMARKDAHVAHDIMEQWIAQATWQPILEGQFISRPGLFSWDRADQGSLLLREYLPATLLGVGADFGCGYGFLSAHVLRACPDVTMLYALDVHDWAVEACRKNTAFAGPLIQCRTHDLTLKPDLPALDFIVMNPPFHEGARVQNQLGMTFIQHAAACLKPGGVLYMVANSHLPYEGVLRQSFAGVQELTHEHGFKIIRATI